MFFLHTIKAQKLGSNEFAYLSFKTEDLILSDVFVLGISQSLYSFYKTFEIRRGMVILKKCVKKDLHPPKGITLIVKPFEKIMFFQYFPSFLQSTVAIYAISIKIKKLMLEQDEFVYRDYFFLKACL